MIEQWFADPSKLGATAVLLAVIYALIKGTLVTSGHLEQVVAAHAARVAELIKDRDDYKGMLRDAVILTKRTLDSKGAPSTQGTAP